MSRDKIVSEPKNKKELQRFILISNYDKFFKNISNKEKISINLWRKILLLNVEIDKRGLSANKRKMELKNKIVLYQCGKYISS